MRKYFLAIAVLMMSSAAFCASLADKDAKALLQVSDYLNEKCRGGSGDSPDTQKACSARDTLGEVLRHAGWCYGEPGQYGYQMKWHKCK